MSLIRLKYSDVPGKSPSILEVGELASNIADGNLFYGTKTGVQQFALGTGGTTNTGSLLLTASAAMNIITFTKGNGSTFAITVDTGSGGTTNTGSLLLTASVSLNTITFTKGNGNTFPITVNTGSGSPGGPNTSIQFNGNGVFSGSSAFTFNSGSNALTLTGSLNITGSTTQIGSNTLLGNTTLSGSIIISGSTTSPASPTIKVFGDMETNGVIKFLAVDKNIDTTVSGSYIYVSGSTSDLYFSQNGAGFNNNVRLRWLEGGALYTGLLRGGVISSTPGTTTFNITSGSGLLVTMNASTASEPYPTVQYISWPNFTAQPITYSGSAKITYVGISSAGTVIQQTVPWGTNDINQWDNSLNLGVVLHLSGSVSTGVFNAPQISYGGQQKTDDFLRAFGPLKISGHTLQASGSTLGIQKTGGTSYREGANYVINPNHPSTVIENAISTSKIYRYYLSGSTPVIDTGVGNAGYTEIDPTQYVNTTTGQLVPVTGNNSNQWRWTIQRVFWVPNSPTNAFIVYYGNAEYTTLVDVKNAIDTEPFSEAPNTSQNAIFIGYILVRKGCTDLSDTTGTNAVLVQGGLFRNVGGNGGSGTAAATSLGSLSDVSLSNDTPGDLLVYGTAGEWNNKKQLTGSYGLTGSLTILGPLTTNDGLYTQTITSSFISASGGITGSLFGTASWAQSAITSSYPISVTGSGNTLYSVSPLATPNFGATSTHSIFFGQDAGFKVVDAYYSNFIGRTAGYSASYAEDSNFLGFRAGYFAAYADRSNFIGNQAGSSATYASQSNFLGYQAGFEATYANNSNFLGYQAGYQAYLSNNSTFIGYQAGYLASTASNSTFIGNQSGKQATRANNSIFIGSGSGDTAQNANNSIFIGLEAGKQGTNSSGSIAIGQQAGFGSTNLNNSILIGYQAGKSFSGTGANNIIIGTNISLPNGTSRAVNIGGVLYITGSYGTTAGNPLTTPVSDESYVGIGTFTPSASLHVKQINRGLSQFIVSNDGNASVIQVVDNNIYVPLLRSGSISYDVVVRDISDGRLYVTSSIGGGGGGGITDTGSFATTGSNTFIGNQVITGSLALPTLTGITDTPNVNFTIPYSSGIYKIAAGDPLGIDMGVVIFPSVVEGASLTVIITSNNNALVASPYPRTAGATDITEITGKTIWNFYGIDGYWYGGRLNNT